MNPQYSCHTCGRVVVIPTLTVTARDRKKRELLKACQADGHETDLRYRAGIG